MDTKVAKKELKLVKRNIKKYQKIILAPQALAKTKETMLHIGIGTGIGSIMCYCLLNHITDNRYNDVILKASASSLFSGTIFPYLIYQLQKAKTNFILSHTDIIDIKNQLPFQKHYKNLLQKTLSKKPSSL